MAKKKIEKKEFFTEAQLANDPTIDAKAKVGGEFIHQQEDGEWRGQTLEVKSETNLEKDLGTGSEVIIRMYEFAADPLIFSQRVPSTQELFNSHIKGITNLLWQDGLAPATDIEPRIVVSKEKNKYLIVVHARAMMGQTFIDKPKTLTEILNEGKTKIPH